MTDSHRMETSTATAVATVELGLKVTNRHGMALRTDVQRPRDQGPGPAILLRTPYGTGSVGLLLLGRKLVSLGWAAVFQNVRGRYGSDGDFDPFVHEAEDGEDTLRWLAGRPWFDGRVLTLGISYSTYTAAVLRRANTVARLIGAVAVVPMLNPRDHFYEGDAFRFHWALGWAQLIAGSRQRPLDLQAMVEHRRQPPKDLPTLLGFPEQPWRQWLIPEADAPYWRDHDAFATSEDYGKDDDSDGETAVPVPTLVMGGAYDFSLPSTLDLHRRLVARGESAGLVIGPWEHNEVFECLLRGLTAKTSPTGDPLAQRFLDFLQTHHEPQDSPVTLWRQGSWINTSELESPDSPVESLHLGIDLDLNPLNGTTARGETLSWSVPVDGPTATDGGRLWTAPGWSRGGPWTRFAGEGEPENPWLTGPSLAQDLRVRGSCRLHLRVHPSSGVAAADHRQVDYCARLFDLDPQGHAVWLADAIRRLPAGTDATAELSFGFLCHVFARGHRVALELSGELFPVFNSPSGPRGRLISRSSSRLDLTLDPDDPQSHNQAQHKYKRDDSNEVQP